MFRKFTFFTAIILLILSHQCLAAKRIAEPLETLNQKYTHKDNESAEILEKRISTSVDSNQLPTTIVYKAIRINDQSAIDDYSQISIQFDEYFEKINLDFANVLTANGNINSVKTDAIQIKSNSSENFFEDTKYLAFSLPNINTGSVIEFQYTIESKKPIIPNEFFKVGSFVHWETKSNSNDYRIDYVHYSLRELLFTENQDIKFYYPDNFPVVYTFDSISNTYRWEMENIESIKLERYIPRTAEIVPYIEITTLENWQTVAQWGLSLFEPTIELTPSINKIANTIALDNKTKLDQIRAVYNYVQSNSRYVFAHAGRGGFTPHKASEVLDNGYGDCKDQSILTISILRALGIESYPALVATNNINIPNDKIPMSRFDHMITYIPAQNNIGEIWLDTVGGNYLFPGISNMTNQQTALIIAPETQALSKINSTFTPENLIEMNLHYKIVDISKLFIDFTLDLEGEIESSYRDWVRYSSAPEDDVKNFFSNLYPDAEIKNLTIRNEKDTKRTMQISGTYFFDTELAGENLPYRFGLNAKNVSDVFSLIPQLNLSGTRQHPFGLSRSFDLKVNSTIDKPKYYVLENNKNLTQSVSNIAYKYEHNIKDNINNVTVNQKFNFYTYEIEPNQYNNIYNSYKKLVDIGWLVHLTYNKNSSIINNLENKTTNLEGYINLIQAFLDSGDYKKAIQYSVEANKVYADNGNIFYLKGLAYAYIGNNNKAKIAFNKAEELGYDI